MIIVGVDEAGRGALAGPVVAAAVVLSKDMDLSIIKDSKELSPTKRIVVAQYIKDHATMASLALADNSFIDKENILQATFAAMKGAVMHADYHLEEEIGLILVDGRFIIPGINIPQRAIVNGDKTEKCISAASVIAKVHRDRIMEGYDKVYPQYHFKKHKGYGTRLHRTILKSLGPCPIHRKTFRGVT